MLSEPPLRRQARSSLLPALNETKASILGRATLLLTNAMEMIAEQAEAGATPGLVCENRHPISKKKDGLRWHQKAEFWNQRSCDLCDESIPRHATRWRCEQHCDFNVCEACYMAGSGNEGPNSTHLRHTLPPEVG